MRKRWRGMMHPSQATATAVSAGTNGSLALFGWLTLNDWAAVIGIVCGLGTFGINWYYRCRADKRAERMAALKTGQADG